MTNNIKKVEAMLKRFEGEDPENLTEIQAESLVCESARVACCQGCGMA